MCGLLHGMSHANEYRIPLMSKPPTLDGKIETAEWADAVRIDGFVWQGNLERRQARCYVGATTTHLFFAIWSQTPAEGTILADVKRDSENLVFDDSVEVWIDPTLGQESGRRFQMLANSLGNRWSKMHVYGNVKEDPAWRAEWPMANGLHDGAWHCEVAVPVEAVAPGRKVTDGVWGFNLCRNWKQEWAFSSIGGGGYAPSDSFVFTTEPTPAVSLEQRGDPFTGDTNWVMALRNPSATPGTVQALLYLERDIMPELKNAEIIALAPGETKEFPLKVTDQTTKKYKLTAKVSSPDGKTTYFSRNLGWTATGTPWKWTTKKRVIPPLDFQFAYYPYLNRMRVLADTSNLPKGAVLEQLTATVRPKGGAAVKTVKFDNLKDGKQELLFDLPPLKGECEVALKATGNSIPADEVVKTFERTVFEWERNKLGKTTKVYPPFTPIRVKGKTLSTVLRDHAMNDAGLWDQVVATGKPILAAPMRWVVSVDGAATSVKPQPLKFVKTVDNTAVAKSGITAGSLKADVTSTWDYDGLMRVDLTLQPTGGKKVDALTLDIPFNNSAATHYHAMGDGIRNTLYDKVPAGDGVVWTAAKVQCNDIPKSFCTYIYVGTPVRGLCWFAENDRNWGRDPKTPNVELVRTGDQVVMRVHLINTPEAITAPRTLTFGLMAAPVKPRITPNWRYQWRRDRYSLLGTDINWLALGDCGSVYPAKKDLYLWEMIKRGNQERLTEADIQKVIERGKPYFEPYGEEKVKSFIAHVRYNLVARYGTKMVFYYNRSSFQDAEEFETFKDEWNLTDYRTIGKGNGIGEIAIVPSESYIDHALYWYGKSFDIGGNQGVYWDNYFFRGSYNTTLTNAYRKPDGSVVPSTGVWGMRDLVKRTFQYMNERGMLPITMPHMTSTGILPLYSFATVQYDWEWKYGEGDVQYRFPREYILMVTDGELAGVWPVLLGDQGNVKDDVWMARTYAAVCMLHELDGSFAPWTKSGQAQLALFKPVDEILAQPGVEAYRYWDERPQPVVTDNPDLPTIVYSVKGKQAVFAVVSYSEKDEPANVTIDAATLGFPKGCKVTDTETEQEVSVTNNMLSFPLKKHDIRVYRIEEK